jgi:hypothetical protein
MNWRQLLIEEIETSYKVTDDLIKLVDKDKLDWKPSPKNNWMTTGQLLLHITNSCGMCFKGFITGDWGMPKDMDMSKMSIEDMLPPAEKMPTIKNVVEAKKLLAADKKLALATLADCSDRRLNTAKAPAPWDPTPMVLGRRLLLMIAHLNSHKAQLFYYLKLQGKPVNTRDLWGK